jgi:hypothetical protein
MPITSPEEEFPDLASSTAADPPQIDITKRLNEFIALELSAVEEVEYVFTAFRNNVFYVWVLLDRFEAQVRNRIYEIEMEVIDEFPMFEFDFYLIAGGGNDSRELISGSIELVYCRHEI